MARGRKKKEKVERVIKIKRSEVVAFYQELRRVKEQQSNYAGKAGKDTRDFTERTGLSPIAVTFISRLDKLGDDLKRQSVIDEVISLFNHMGWDDQKTLFGRAELKMKNDFIDDDEDDEKEQPTGSLKQDGLPLDEARDKFEAAAKKNPPQPGSGRKAESGSPLASEEPLAVH